MDNMYQNQAPPPGLQHPAYPGSFVEPPYHNNRPPFPPGAPQTSQWAPGSAPTQAAPHWTPPPGYGGHHQYGLGHPPPNTTEGVGFGGPHMGIPYGFDPSVPPPPFGCPPGHYPNTPPSLPANSFSSVPPFGVGTQPRYDNFPPALGSGEEQQQNYEETRGYGAHSTFTAFDQRPTMPSVHTEAEDEATAERRQDLLWIRRFLERRTRGPKSPQTGPEQRLPHITVPIMKEALYGAVQLLQALEKSCETLKDNIQSDSVWTDSYESALNIKKELDEKMNFINDEKVIKDFKARLVRIQKKGARRLRAKKLLQEEMKQRQEDVREKEAAADAWMMKKRHEVEEKKKAQELKLAADGVLSEVRKKQADIKRMQDILKSLEKLRKLRKEAASRKGITTEQECDDVFNSRLERLRTVLKKRTSIYAAEEKALMVMLEGEQEEERRKEQERRLKKERERQLQKKQEVDAMLFGDEDPVDPLLQPFRDYYTQAEHSLLALVQIRRDWDGFIVGADHPEGSLVPQSWVIPDPPSDKDWAVALQTTDND